MSGRLGITVDIKCAYVLPVHHLTSSLLFYSATFDRIAEINFNLDADDNSVSV